MQVKNMWKQNRTKNVWNQIDRVHYIDSQIKKHQSMLDKLLKEREQILEQNLEETARIFRR